MTSRCFVPTSGPECWKPLLADPEKQWQRGYSARTLAHAWEAADGLPPEIADLFVATPELSDVPPELLVALPEYKVPLPGGRRESQNDVFAIVSGELGLMTMMVEGKVNEAFGPTIGAWLQNPSSGKRERLSHICGLLGLENDPPASIRYQLLHRTASAVIERGRYNAAAALMVVHSFSQEKRWYEDYEAFCDLLGVTARSSCLVRHDLPDRYPLYLGWATGAAEHLEA